MQDIIGVLVTLMFVGYCALEVGRFRRARELGREEAWYSWSRVMGRVAMGLVVTAMAWMWAMWDSLMRRYGDATGLVVLGMGVLLLLLLLDLVGLSIQYGRERKRREKRFAREMEQVLLSGVKGGSGQDKRGE